MRLEVTAHYKGRVGEKGEFTQIENAKAWAVGQRLAGATFIHGRWYSGQNPLAEVRFYPLNPKWTVYGRRKVLPQKGFAWRPKPGSNDVYAPLHKEGFTSEADATLFLMDTVMQYGATEVDAVIVRLDNGEDRNGERQVVRRVGEGKAWWE